MNANSVFHWGWRILLVGAVLVTVATLNRLRTGQASGPRTTSEKQDTVRPGRRSARKASQSTTSERGAKPRARPTASARSLRGDQPFRASDPAAGAQAGPALCSQTANCQARDDVDAKRSNRTEFNVADDFRPVASGSLTEVCWWGTYGDDDSGPLVDCHVPSVADTFEITYCNDAGGVPGTTCTTFSQALGSLIVTGPTPTFGSIAGFLPEFAYSATHASFAVTADECYWIEITNNSGTCTWFWEVSNEGGDWAILDGDGIDPPNGFDLDEFVLLDFAFCVDVGLDAASPCGPPSNGTCPNLAQDCCEGDPLEPPDVSGCQDDLCCRRVCACDPFCCDNEGICSGPGGTCTIDTDCPTGQTCDAEGTCNGLGGTCLIDADCPAGQTCVGFGAWDEFCAGQGQPTAVEDEFTGCGAEVLCVQECSPCGGPDTGDCCTDTGSASCSDAPCCEAVCAVDPYCCETEWDGTCAAEAETICPQLCEICGNPASGDCCTATPLEPGCSNRACCDAVCSADSACCGFIGWDGNCATIGFGTTRAGAFYLCTDLCSPCTLCGDIAGDAISINGPGSSADLADYFAFLDCFGADLRARPECFCADLNDDQVIDILDHAILVDLLESASTNSPPNCAPPP